MAEPVARLYLIAPSSDGVAEALEAALRAGDVACVLLPATSPDLPALVRAVQAHGTAALVADDVALAVECGADGVNIGAAGDLKAAVRRIRPAGIVGAADLATRDDAMTAGEADVDYVMFGDRLEDGAPAPFETRLDRVAWWTEIFEVPCVAVAHGMSEVAELAAAGAEFVALRDIVWRDPRGAAAAVQNSMRALREGHARYAARQAERV